MPILYCLGLIALMAICGLVILVVAGVWAIIQTFKSLGEYCDF